MILFDGKHLLAGRELVAGGAFLFRGDVGIMGYKKAFLCYNQMKE